MVGLDQLVQRPTPQFDLPPLGLLYQGLATLRSGEVLIPAP
jgi:hypothetical protein